MAGRKLTVGAVYATDEDGNGVLFKEGDEVPAWAAEQMGDHCFAGDSGVSGPDPDADEAAKAAAKAKEIAEALASKKYDGLTNEVLSEEVARRNEGRDDDAKVNPAGAKKAELVAALEADDTAQG